MRIGLVIADFEMSYSTSFQHTSRVKYLVDFNSSIVQHIKTNLCLLRERVARNEATNVHVGFEISVEDVEHVQHLLNQIVEKYTADYNDYRQSLKINSILQKLREANTPTAKDLAKEVLGEVLGNETPEKQTKKQRIEEEANRLSIERRLKTLKKKSTKP